MSYELSGLAHWTGAIRRTINDQTAMGGYVIERGEGGRQLETINPAWLRQGENHIRFVPIADDERYTVGNVEVLIELDNGSNFVSYVRSNLSDGKTMIANLYDGDIATGLSVGRQQQMSDRPAG